MHGTGGFFPSNIIDGYSINAITKIEGMRKCLSTADGTFFYYLPVALYLIAVESRIVFCFEVPLELIILFSEKLTFLCLCRWS